MTTFCDRAYALFIAGTASAFLVLTSGACAGGDSCSGDGDCAAGEVCVKSGGVLFGGNECIPERLVDGTGGDDAGNMCPGGMGQKVPNFDPSSCQTSNNGVEICDGEDNDCNGRIDDCVQPTSCSLQKGVCEGATTATCAANRPGYADCGLGQYGEAFVSQDDEAWRCDEKDNDCDGAVDEFCCDNAQNSGTNSFSPHKVGQLHVPDVYEPYDGIVPPKLVRPLRDAPEEAIALVARKSNQGEVTLKHVSAAGKDVGQLEKIGVGGTFTGGTTTIYQEISGLGLVRTDKRYHLIIARSEIRKPADKNAKLEKTSLLTRTLDADLSVKRTSQIATPDDIQTRLDAEFLDGRVVLMSNEHNTWEQISVARVVARTYKLDETSGPGPLEAITLPNIVETDLQTGSGRPSGLVAETNITSHSQHGFAVGWATTGKSTDEGQINVVSLDPSGNVVGAASATRPLTTSVNREATSRMGVAWTGENRVTVVFDRRIGLRAFELNTRTGSLEGQSELSATGRAPAMVARDTDGDMFADTGTVIWQTQQQALTGATAAEWNIDGDRLPTSNAVLSERQGLGFPTVLGVPHGAVVAWPEQPSQGKAYTLFAAIGTEGSPICPPQSTGN